MRLIRFSVNHPVTICMLILGLVMGGIYSLSRMEVELLPGISIPTLVITTEVPRTSPETVHREVTLPLEEALNGVGDLVTINSISLEGESRLLLEFDWGCNVRNTEIEVRERINAISLPDAASQPLIRRFDPSQAPVFRMDILGEGLSPEILSGVADRTIKPRLERLAGVGEVEIIGGTDPEFRVIGDRERLGQYNLTLLSLIRCISTELKNRKGGTVEIEGGRVAALRIQGKANTIRDLENLIVAVPASGTPIRVRDVATVIRTNREVLSYARIDGMPSVGLSIKKSSDASVVTVVKRIRQELTRMDPVLQEKGIDLRISQDDSEYVLSSQSLVVSSIVQGAGLAGILLFLFLRDLRAAVIVVLATPVSLISAAIFLNGMGVSRNILTLGGMGLSVGLTLDSSIVLIDSIFKQLGQGLSPREAAIRGTSEVAAGIFSSTMTSVAVFVPILFIPGLMQEMFESLALAIIWSVLMSMVVGILFIPMISARILSPRRHGSEPGSRLRRALSRPFTWTGERMNRFDRFSESTLSRILGFLLKSISIKVGILVVMVAVSIASLKFLPGRGFVPEGNVDELWIRFDPPAGSTLDYVDDRVRQVEELLKSEPYSEFVSSVSSIVRQDEGRLFVRLFPRRLAPEESPEAGWIRSGEWKALSGCLQQIREGCDSIPDLGGNNFISPVDKIRGATRAPIVFKIYSKATETDLSEAEQLKRLRSEAEAFLLPEIEKVPSAIYQRVIRNEAPKEIIVSSEFDREKLSEKGVSTTQISDTIRASIYGVNAATVWDGEREIDVSVILDDGDGDGSGDFSLDSVRSLQVRSPLTGLLHQVDELAMVSEVPSEGGVILERTNRKATVNLESHFAPFDLTGETIGDVTSQMEESLLSLPGFSDTYDYRLQSEAKDTRESFADAFLALLISVGLIYMIMSSQFENFRDPLAVMVTVPLATAGSVLMLRVTGEIFSLGAFTGAVILCGVVVNNGIIMIEHVNILRRRGVRRDSAIIKGAVRKMRSIQVTSLTSILGMLPLVFGTGEGTELYRGVAAVILGGLLISTPLTLIVLPLFYSLLDEWSNFADSLGFRLASGGKRFMGGGES